MADPLRPASAAPPTGPAPADARPNRPPEAPATPVSRLAAGLTIAGGALLTLLGLVLAVAGTIAVAGGVDAAGVVVYGGLVVVTAVLGTGTVLLLARRRWGLVWLAAGAGAAAAGLLVLLIRAADPDNDPATAWGATSEGAVGVLALGGVALAITLVTLLLATLPATRRWCRPTPDAADEAAARRLEQRQASAGMSYRD